MPVSLEWLRDQIALRQGRHVEDGLVVATGWGPVDQVLGGLRRGAIHEWFTCPTDGLNKTLTPPLMVLSYLCSQALQMIPEAWVLCVGRRVWPSPLRLACRPRSPEGATSSSLPGGVASSRPTTDSHGRRNFACSQAQFRVSAPWKGELPETSDPDLRSKTSKRPASGEMGMRELGRQDAAPPGDESELKLLRRWLVIDTPRVAERIWAIDATLRCRGMIVLADGSGLDTAATRRLQLAAEAGGSLGLIARPPRERDRISIAETRWEVSPAISPNECARWVLRVMRSRGSAAACPQVLVECSHDGSVVCVPEPVGQRPGASETQDRAGAGDHPLAGRTSA